MICLVSYCTISASKTQGQSLLDDEWSEAKSGKSLLFFFHLGFLLTLRDCLWVSKDSLVLQKSPDEMFVWMCWKDQNLGIEILSKQSFESVAFSCYVCL